MKNEKREKRTVVELNRGGQTLIHFLRMLHQTLKHYSKAILTVYAIASISLGYCLTEPLDRYMAFKYYFCKLQVDYLGLKNSTATLTLPNGQSVVVSNQTVADNPVMKVHAETLYGNLMLGAAIALIISLFAAYFLYRYLVKRGQEEAEDQHVRGTELVEHKDLKTLAEEAVKRSGFESRFNIVGIPLPRWQENANIALSGSPGSGKSTTFRALLRQLREQNRKTVIYDISGEFVSRFYRPGIDVIINPFDKRSHSWDVWCEGRTEMSYDRQAKACIPASHDGDPFWILSAQLVFSAICQELGDRFEEPKMEHLMNIILRMSAEQIANVVAHTDARNVINLDAEKVASSVRAIITAYTRNLKYFAKTKGRRFSFRDWARDDSNRAWVFITVRDDMKAALQSPLTMLIEAAITAILSLKPDSERVIGVAVDEIKTLHPIPSLLDFAGTARKFGGMPIIGFQSPFQIYELFGEHGAKALFDIIGTYAAFRIDGEDGAEWSAKQLGNQESERANENTSFGANDMRDAVNVNHTNREGSLLLSSQISKLDNLSCYLRLNRGLPVSKVDFEPDRMPTLHEGIVEADYLKDQENRKRFSIENSSDPESVVSAIFHDAKVNNVADVRSWDGIKKTKSDSDSNNENTSGNNNTSESQGEGISGGVDLMALAMDREEVASERRQEPLKGQQPEKSSSPELDIGF